MGSAGNGPKQKSYAIVAWIMVAGCVSVLSQAVRLQQMEPALWIFWDYAGRLAALALLAINPAVQATVYRREPLNVSLAIAINWGLLLIPIMFAAAVVGHFCGSFLPDLRLDYYPQPKSLLRFFDLTFGLALVAVHEEILFRGAMRHVLAPLGEGRAMAVASAVIFGAYHWWTGVPNMISAAAFGYFAMRLYRHAGALWPIMVIHYLTDLWYFA